MSAARFKKIKWILITVITIKLAMMFVFLPNRSEKSMITGDTAIAQDEPAAEATEENAETDGTDERATPPEADSQLVLDGLEEKRKMLMEKEEQLKLEEERLSAYKKEIEEKIEKLSAVYRQIEEGLAKLEKKETEEERLRREAEAVKMAQLVKVFSSMKPKKAAEIVNNMDIEAARKLFLKLKGDRAGEILSFVNPDKAAQISEKLTERKEMFDGR